MHLSSTINLGQHFKKKLYTTNKTDIISTNSFSRHTKKIRKCLSTIVLKRSTKMNKKEEKSIYKSNDPHLVYLIMTFL